MKTEIEVREILKQYQEILNKTGFNNPHFEARQIVCIVLKHILGE